MSNGFALFMELVPFPVGPSPRLLSVATVTPNQHTLEIVRATTVKRGN
jgi:hypothetical protein